MTFAFTLDLPTVLVLVTAVLAIIDGIARVRSGRAGSVLAVIEIIAAALLGLSVFIGIPVASWLIPLILAVVLVLLLFVRGRARRGFVVLTVVALVLDLVVLLGRLGWLHIPGLS